MRGPEMMVTGPALMSSDELNLREFVVADVVVRVAEDDVERALVHRDRDGLRLLDLHAQREDRLFDRGGPCDGEIDGVGRRLVAGGEDEDLLQEDDGGDVRRCSRLFGSGSTAMTST